MADVAITKGETPAGDRTWLSFPDGTARRAVVHVIHDLPHLVVESAFGLGDGLWGTLACGGFANATRALGIPGSASSPTSRSTISARRPGRGTWSRRRRSTPW
jgi:hypothetical protein